MDHLPRAAKIYSAGRENAIFCGFNSSLTTDDVLVTVFLPPCFEISAALVVHLHFYATPKPGMIRKKIKIYLDFSFLL